MSEHPRPEALARWFDAAAEASVVGSFSRAGIVARRYLEQWSALPGLSGSTAIVTGATSGIGLAAALRLAQLGATVHIIGRDEKRCRLASDRVEHAGDRPAPYDVADLGDIASVGHLAHRLAERYPRVDALVHAAGSLSRQYRQAPDGTELTVATQVLAPYVLTAGLARSLAQAAGNVVLVSSGGMYTQPFDLGALVMTPDGYRGPKAYARAKRAQVVLARALSGAFAGTGVACYSMHPGWVDTPGLRSGLPLFYKLLKPLLRTPDEGADTVTWLAAGGARRPAPDGHGADVASLGGFYLDRKCRAEVRGAVRHPYPPTAETDLLTWCAQHTGTVVPELHAARPGDPGA